MLSVFLLILAVIYYYAFIGTLLLKFSANSGIFSNFKESFITLIQIMTLDSWAEIARPALREVNPPLQE